MKRRSFLAMLGLAPISATGAALAAPKSFADGGNVGPIKGYAIGESGPETIIPLRRDNGKLSLDAAQIGSVHFDSIRFPSGAVAVFSEEKLVITA